MGSEVHLRKYGAATTFDFDLYEIDGVDLRVDATHASGDSKVMKDEGAEANTASGFVDEGQGYSIALSDAEMTAARIKVIIVDQTATKAWLDRTITIETYGHASAQHAMDFDDGIRGGMTALPNAAADAAGGLAISDAGALDLDAKLANTHEITAARAGTLTDWINGGRLDLLLDAIPTTAMRGTDSAALASVATETRLARLDATISSRSSHAAAAVVALMNDLSSADAQAAADAALVANHLDHLLKSTYDAASKPGAADALMNEMVEDDAGVTRYTENALEQAPSGTGASAATIADAVCDEILNEHTIDGSLSKKLTDVPTTAMRGTDSASTHNAAAVKTAVEAAGSSLATLLGRITALLATKAEMDAAHGLLATPAEVNDEVSDVLKTDAIAEPAQGLPPKNPTFETLLAWLWMRFRNQSLQTNAEDAIHNDAGTKLAKRAVSDDGTTLTKGKLASGA